MCDSNVSLNYQESMVEFPNLGTCFQRPPKRVRPGRPICNISIDFWRIVKKHVVWWTLEMLPHIEQICTACHQAVPTNRTYQALLQALASGSVLAMNTVRMLIDTCSPFTVLGTVQIRTRSGHARHEPLQCRTENGACFAL